MLSSTFLRDIINLTGTHVGCDTSQCGACVVHVDGKSMKSCTLLALDIDGSKVTTIERIKYIYELACENLENYNNIEIIHGDGSLGFVDNAPYNKIMVTCGSPQVPKPLVDQLDFDGLMVIPVGNRVAQELLTIKRTKNGIDVNRRPGVAFVPMIGTNAFES